MRRAEGERKERGLRKEGRFGLDGATARIGRKKRGTPRRRLSNVASGEEIGNGRERVEGAEEEGEERFEQQKEGRNGRFELESKYQLLPSVREPQQDRRRRRRGGGGRGACFVSRQKYSPIHVAFLPC